MYVSTPVRGPYTRTNMRDAPLTLPTEIDLYDVQTTGASLKHFDQKTGSE